MSIELDVLRRYRLQDSVVDNAARLAARAKLTDHITTASTAPLVSVTENAARPESPTKDRFGRSRASHLAGRIPTWRPYAARAIALATAAAAAAAAVLLGPLQGTPAFPDRAAAAVLERAALAASTNGPGVMAPGQYWYVQSRFTTMRSSQLGAKLPWRAIVSYQVDSWTARNGSGLVRSRILAVRFPTAADHLQWERAGQPQLLKTGTLRLAPNPRWIPVGHGLTYAEMIALPTNPAALAARLLPIWHGTQSGRNTAVLDVIADLLRQNPVPGPLRAALYRLAALTPGIQLSHLARDRNERNVLTVAFADKTGARTPKWRLLFDPRTSELIGESAGAGPQQSSYDRQAIVQHVGQR